MKSRRADVGSATVELVLVIPMLVLLLWFLVFCGRMTDSRLRIEDVAHQAARAASLQRTASAAASHARTTAAAGLSQAGVTCQALTVETSGSVQPGDTITTTVACRVELHDLALLQVPGTQMLRASFAVPVDTYRSVGAAVARGGATQ
ncbi:TadE/TadG family type IV pilus assembly protein [Streptomyces sp. AN091965]|uniref:TadE/TadG family type IV pilus assembly protein n=1 Tax=Streptomyces sp. AN091965 TaxID=2927803 RepID=UPI001F60D0C6|nr:TadE/TadG family type IV pilus assembly protein [Streptomyces sp. AN091965]MCI3928828.1 pilus assembly protein [Streptomyces sp. AN091965]